MVNERRAIRRGDCCLMLVILKGVAVASFSAGIIVALLVGKAAITWLQTKPIDGCLGYDLAYERPELFEGVDTMCCGEPQDKRGKPDPEQIDFVTVEWTGSGHMNKAAVKEAFGYDMPFPRCGPGFRMALPKAKAEALVEAVQYFKIVPDTSGSSDKIPKRTVRKKGAS